MSTPNISDALAHLNEAFDLLTIEATGIPVDESQPTFQVPRLQFTLGDEMDRVERALSSKGSTLLSGWGDSVRQAVIEIEAARNALKGERA